MRTPLRARPLLAILLLHGAALLAGCEWFDEAPPAQPETRAAVATLEVTLGEVILERDGVRGAAALGALYPRDTLETPVEGGATIRLSDGRSLQVGPEARFMLDAQGDAIVLEVARGLVLSRVSKTASTGPGVVLQILTPFGLTRVTSADSEVQVEVGKDEATVEVLVGSIEFVSRNGQPVAVNAGEQLAASSESVALVARKEEEPAPREIALEPIEVVVFATRGKVELRKKDQQRWQSVARTGTELSGGDAVRVREGRSLLSLTSGTRVWLERASEAEFVGSARKAGVEETELALRKGAVTLSLAPNQKSRVALGSGLLLQSDLGGQFAVQKTGDGFEVVAVAGDAELTRAGARQRVQAGQTARLGKEGQAPRVTTADREALALPTALGQRVFHPGVRFGAITWVGPPERIYVVEVALDAAFRDKVVHGRVYDTFLNVALPRRGALHWRVFREDGTTLVDRGSATFSPEPKRSDLARLRNEVPDGSERTTIYYQDKPPAVSFTYAPETAAARYRVVVFRATDLSKPVADRTVSEATAALEAGALTEGSYVWSVTPLAASGEALRGGKMNKLELVYDNSVPELLVRGPQNGERLRGGVVRTHGVAPVGARLLVNGKRIELDEKNRFDTSVTIASGSAPQVIFRLTRPGAPDTFTVRTLRRAR